MTRPAPLVPSEVDLTSLEYMPLYIEKLRRSKAWLTCKRNPRLAYPLMNLWMRAWREQPAGSLEADDDVLAEAAGLDFDKFQELRDDLLRGWKLCSDGRYYIPAMVPMVHRGWETVTALKRRGKAGAAGRWGPKKDASRHTTKDAKDDANQLSREVSKERGATRPANSHDAYLDTLTWARDPAKPVTDPVALRVIDALGGIDHLRTKTPAALADLIGEFKSRYAAEAQ